MYFWRQALENRRSTRSVGFVATARLRLQQNNALFSVAIKGSGKQIYFAVPDHKWPDDAGSASVRICMVAAGNDRDVAKRVVWAPDANQTAGQRYSDEEYSRSMRTVTVPFIPPNLDPALGAHEIASLASNATIASAGVKPYARGFIVTEGKALDGEVRPFANGATIGQNRPLMRIVDVNHLTEAELRLRHPRCSPKS